MNPIRDMFLACLCILIYISRLPITIILFLLVSKGLYYIFDMLGIMFGATVVRQKRERERQDRLSRGNDPPVIPYIKPFGVRFDASQLPYFKYRKALAQLEAEKADCHEVG
jgi:hypothetical protein